MYDPMDQELVQGRATAHDLCFELRTTRPGDRKKIIAITNRLFQYPTEEIFITPPFFCDYGYNIKLGKNFYCNADCIILDCAPVEIGENVLLGPRVQILTPMHPLHAEERVDKEYALPVCIGARVWIGAGAIICPGVTIGDGCVIGAGSIVTRNIEPFTLAVGNPCKPLRKLGK